MKTSIAACLAIACLFGAAHAQAPVIGQGGAAPGPPFVNRGSHAHIAGPTPIISNCGSAPEIDGSDMAGFFVTGTGVAGNCTITFVTPWLNNGITAFEAPFCLVTMRSTNMGLSPPVLFQYKADTIAITIQAGVGDSQFFNYTCVGNNLP
jgi:hypothetical protein